MLVQRRSRRVVLFSLGALALAVASDLSLERAGAQESAKVDFARQVQPILARRCFKCHGPDHAEGGLRLDTAEGLSAELDSGSIGIVSGEPERSEVLVRIRSEDESLRMPPEGKPLSETEADLIERWIGEGGEWAEHWAFRPIARPEVPSVSNAAWVRQPIDAFVMKGLEQAGLAPASPASKVALIRRAYYDLIGLPPTPAQIEAFVADESPEAFERVIDRLLASEQYGEKWARHWLDLVRYAETNGYERDSAKDLIWKYRDYVIRAFNADKPFDRFVTEQLAGDELPDADADTITATGYYRLGIWDDEPADRELARYDYLDDLVRTTGETFLGLTIGCARCHDHKIDPISQRDYYSMVAFFSDITDHGAGGTNHVPLASAGDRAAFDQRVAEKQAREEQLGQDIAAIEKTILEKVSSLEGGAELIAEAGAAGTTNVADSISEGQEWRYTTDQPDDRWFDIGFDAGAWKTGLGGFGSRGTPGAVVRTDWKSSDIWLRRDFRLDRVPRQVTLKLHHDEDVEIYLNGQSIFSRQGYSQDYAEFDVTTAVASAVQTGKNVLAVHCRQTGGGQYIDAGLVFDSGDPIDRFVERFGADALGSDLLTRRAELKAELVASTSVTLEFQPEVAMAVAERGPRPTWILQRGLPAMKGEEVGPAFPDVLDPPAPAVEKREGMSSSGKRMALAKWLTDPANPLVARVMVNRIWQHHFGRGLVRSTSDFGFQGSPPTHPELLDWLSTDLVEHGWRIKRMHKMIMLSSTYQMSSQGNQKALALDPTNDRLWRFDMRRLTAEEIRDSLLAVGGTLNLEMYGAPIYPPLSAEVLATSSRPDAAWGRSTPQQAARRTIYVHVKRSLRPPMLSSFDAADTDATCPVRMVTTVPTQALGMLNSEFMQQQAQEFSDRLLREAGEDAGGRVELAIRLISGRVPLEAEVSADLAFIERLKSEEGLSDAEAWRMYGLMMLNANEFIYLD